MEASTPNNPWIEYYLSNGRVVTRIFARPWKIGEDPQYDGLWRIVAQPVAPSGVVMAEYAKIIGYTPKEQVLIASQKNLGVDYILVEKPERKSKKELSEAS
jgi:hypothetical protein